MTKIDLVKGFRDYTGEEALKRAKVKEIIEKAFSVYGFEPAETPIIENEEFVKGDNSDDEAVSDVFKLKDKGKRKLALRYEFTFQAKRIAQNKKLPYKRYCIGPVFRDEPVRPGRYRQFIQCDVDIIGASEITADAEILALAKTIFYKLKIPIEIQVNNRKLLSAIVGKFVRDKNTEKAIVREIDKLVKDRDGAYKGLVGLLGEKRTDELLSYFDKDLKFFIKEGFEGADEIRELEKLCKIYGVKIKFVPSLARGLSYYVGNIFEIVSPKYKFTITAGGRYNVNGNQSVGISFGLDRLAEIAEGLDIRKVKAMVISVKQDEEAIKLTEKLRSENVGSVVMYGKIGKAMEYANAKDISYAIFVGEREAKEGKFKLRDMKTGKEKLLSLDKLVKELR